MLRSLILCLLLAGCRSSPAASTPDPSSACQLVEEDFGPAGQTPIRAEVVVDGLEVPWGIAFLPNGDWLVTERPGRLRLVRDGALVEAPVAVVDVAGQGEGGLLGIALHPRFEENSTFFLAYTYRTDEGERANRLERWRLSEDGLRASVAGVLVDGIPGHTVHDGGRLRLGPDGQLYLGTGDAGEPARAQDPESLGGKLLRVDPEGGSPTAVLSGLRNPQGFDWLDEATLAVVDHGPSGERGRRGHDEVSVAQAGENLGWPTIFGCEEQEGLVSPALTWVRATPPGGAAIYRGERIPGWDGSLLVGTLGSRHLHRVVFSASDRRKVDRHEVYFEGTWGRLRDVAMGPDGHVYVTTSNCDGRGDCPEERDRILRIVPGP